MFLITFVNIKLCSNKGPITFELIKDYSTEPTTTITFWWFFALSRPTYLRISNPSEEGAGTTCSWHKLVWSHQTHRTPDKIQYDLPGRAYAMCWTIHELSVMAGHIMPFGTVSKLVILEVIISYRFPPGQITSRSQMAQNTSHQCHGCASSNLYNIRI